MATLTCYISISLISFLNKIKVSMATFHFPALLNTPYRTYQQKRAGITATTANLNICNILCSVLLSYSSKQTLEGHLQVFSFALTNRARAVPSNHRYSASWIQGNINSGILLNKVKICFSGNETGCLIKFSVFPLITVSLQAEEKQKDVFIC